MHSVVLLNNSVKFDGFEGPSMEWMIEARRLLGAGRKIAGNISPPSLVIMKEELAELDYFKNSFYDFVSSELDEIILRYVDCELVEANINYGGDIGNGNKFYLFVSDRLRALDVKRSIFTTYKPEEGGGVHTVEKMVLDEKLVCERRAFTLLETMPLIFNDELCLDVKRQNFKGMKFIPISDFEFGRPKIYPYCSDRVKTTPSRRPCVCQR